MEPEQRSGPEVAAPRVVNLSAAKTTKALAWLEQELKTVPEDTEAMEVEEGQPSESAERPKLVLTSAPARLTLENVSRVSAAAEELGPRQLVAPTLQRMADGESVYEAPENWKIRRVERDRIRRDAFIAKKRENELKGNLSQSSGPQEKKLRPTDPFPPALPGGKLQDVLAEQFAIHEMTEWD